MGWSSKSLRMALATALIVLQSDVTINILDVIRWLQNEQRYKKKADRGFAAYVFRRVVVHRFMFWVEWFIGGEQLSYGIACSIAIPPLAVGRSVSLINEL